MTLRVVELFAGIGAQAMALEILDIDFESTVCEIDPHAYRAYCAIHGVAPNLGDITEVSELPECDLLTYSYPCTSVSIAGKQGGMVEGSGTASSLVWEVGRLLRTAAERERCPEVLLMENVDAVLNNRNRSEFDRWIAFLGDLGYTSSWKVLNAKDYGVPQNRKRIFVVSTLHMGAFVFPSPCPDGRVLKDVLEDDVPEEYFLSDERVAVYERHRVRHLDKGHGFGWPPSEPVAMAYTLGTKPDRPNQNFIIVSGTLKDPTRYESTNRVYDPDGIAPTITTMQGGGQVPKIEQTTADDPSEDVPEMRDGDVVAMLTPHRTKKRQRGPRYKGDGTSFTVTCQDRNGIAIAGCSGLRIRILTPRECWRLQGFPDWAYNRAVDAGASKTQLYKQAGNSIAVPCLVAIFHAIYIDRTFVRGGRQVSLEAFT